MWVFDEDLGEPGLIKEIRFYLFLKRHWIGEITRCPHSGKSSMHSFDMEAVDVDGNKYFFGDTYNGYTFRMRRSQWCYPLLQLSPACDVCLHFFLRPLLQPGSYIDHSHPVSL